MLYLYPSCVPVAYTQTVILKTLKNPKTLRNLEPLLGFLFPPNDENSQENSQEFSQTNFYLQQSFQPDEKELKTGIVNKNYYLLILLLSKWQ